MLVFRLLSKKILAKPADLAKEGDMDCVGLEHTMQNKAKSGFALRVNFGKQLNTNIKTMLSNESIFNDLLACYNIIVIIFCREYISE